MSAEAVRTQHGGVAVAGFCDVVASRKDRRLQAGISWRSRQADSTRWQEGCVRMGKARKGASGSGALAGGGRYQVRSVAGRFRTSLQRDNPGRGVDVWIHVHVAPKDWRRLNQKVGGRSTAGRAPLEG